MMNLDQDMIKNFYAAGYKRAGGEECKRKQDDIRKTLGRAGIKLAYGPINCVGPILGKTPTAYVWVPAAILVRDIEQLLHRDETEKEFWG